MAIMQHPVTLDTPKDAAVSKSLAKWFAETAEYSRRVIGKTLHPVLPLQKNEYNCTMNELFCRAIMAAAGTGAAIHGTVSKYTNFTGAITERNLFDALPFEDTVGVLYLTESELKEVIAEQINQYAQGRFQSFSGFGIHLDSSAKISFKPDLKLDQKTGRIAVAFNSFALAGASRRFPKLKELALNPECRPFDTEILVRDAVREYISRNSPLNIKIKKEQL